MQTDFPVSPQRSKSSFPSVSELLVVDADPQTVEFCRDLEGTAGLTIRAAHDSETALDVLESGLVDVLLLSQEFAGEPDLEFLRHLHYWYPETQVIMLAERPSYASAVEATKLGAFDYMPKPLETQLLQNTIERAMEYGRTAKARTALREPVDSESAYGIVGKTAVMWKLYKVIEKVLR